MSLADEIDKEKFKKMYYVDEMTKKDLAKYYDVTVRTITNIFNEYEMETLEHDKYKPTPEHIKKVTENLPDSPPAKLKTWDLSEKARKAINKAISRANTKHGLYADIPIICHSDDCPYKETCELYEKGEEPENERCPYEIATIMKLTREYSNEFDIDLDNTTALSLVRDLVNAEVSIRRTDKLISIEGNPIEEVSVGVTDDGRPITRPEITKPYELKEKLLKRKHRIMSKLNATPKDKAKTEKDDTKDFSSYMSELFQSMKNDKDDDIPEVIVVNEDEQEEE